MASPGSGGGDIAPACRALIASEAANLAAGHEVAGALLRDVKLALRRLLRLERLGHHP